MSEETKRKVSESKRGSVPWNKGVPMSEETRMKLSVAIGMKKGFVTPLHFRIRMSQKYKDWRMAVFQRDGFTCVWCGDLRGKNGGGINADHIKPFSLFPDLRFDTNNGRTLCISCHKKTDTYGFNKRYIVYDY